MVGSMVNPPTAHPEDLLIMNQYYYGEDACGRNAPTKLLIQGIDARHGPLHRSTSTYHPLRLPIHLYACGLLVTPVVRGRGRTRTARRTALISTINIGDIRRIILAWEGRLPIHVE
jgi:hypothetical protein